MTHPCICCKKEYDCPPCNTNMMWACSTVNGDEDRNMCDACLELAAADMYARDSDNL